MATLQDKIAILILQVHDAESLLSEILRWLYAARDRTRDDTVDPDEVLVNEKRAVRALRQYDTILRDLRNTLDEPAGDANPFPRNPEAWEPTAEQAARLTPPDPGYG